MSNIWVLPSAIIFCGAYCAIEYLSHCWNPFPGRFIQLKWQVTVSCFLKLGRQSQPIWFYDPHYWINCMQSTREWGKLLNRQTLQWQTNLNNLSGNSVLHREDRFCVRLLPRFKVHQRLFWVQQQIPVTRQDPRVTYLDMGTQPCRI